MEALQQTSANLLHEAWFLEVVLSFIPGHWFIIAAVSIFWRETYADMEGTQILPAAPGARLTKRLHKGSLYSSALASPALVRLAHDSGLAFTSPHKLAKAAVQHASLPTLLAAGELGMLLTQNQTVALSTMAAAQRSLPVLKWLSTQPQCKFAGDIGLYAAIGGSVEVFEWLNQQGIEFTVATMHTAAEYKHNAAVQYLHSVGCPWSLDVASFAAMRGDFEMLRWACEHGDAGWSTLRVLNKAAASCSVEMGGIVQQPGFVLLASAMCAAAEYGRTAVCEYLLSHGCPMTARACTKAAAGGHLSTLQWLRDNGCPWTVDAVCAAAAEGSLVEVLAYVQQQRMVPTVAQLTDMLVG
jgi:hypothetical protein